MKKIFLAALAACAIFASCTKENESASNGTQSIAVQFPEGTVITNTRAALIEDPITPGAAETSLTNPIVFLLNGNSVVSVHDVSATIAGNYVYFDDVSSTINGVLVVANVPAGVTDLKDQTSVSAIENYAFTIESQSTAGITGKTLMGKSNVSATTVTNDDKDYKTAVVTLNSLIARFEVGAVKAGEGIESIELVGVWVNSYYASGAKVAPINAATGFNDQNSEYWKTTPDAGVPSSSVTAFSSVVFSGTSKGDEYLPTLYYNADSPQVTLTAGSKAYAFHVFAGANIPHVIMLVKGEYKDEHYQGENKYFLGWVTFTNYLDNLTLITSIVPNTIYKIGLGTSGVVIDADKITPKPEQPKFNLAVKCTIAAWTEKNVTPEAN